MIMLSWVANFAALLLLALAMPRNRKLLLPGHTLPLADTSVRFVGFVLLGLSLYAICQLYPFADALVYWLGQITASAMTVALIVSFRQQAKTRK